jgi:hypothetical protein
MTDTAPHAEPDPLRAGEESVEKTGSIDADAPVTVSATAKGADAHERKADAAVAAAGATDSSPDNAT